MGIFLLLSVGIWLGCSALGVPRSARWLMIALLYTAVLASTILLSDGQNGGLFGGSTGEWLVVGGLGAVVWAYMTGLRRLRSRAQTDVTEAQAPSNSAEIERYARHVVLREIGGQGQKRLKEARVLVIGAGGLGSPALQYLAACGVGTIGVIDDDIVSNSNLQRQVIHLDAHIGMPKVFSAEKAMVAQNPFVTVRPYNRRLTEEIVDDLFGEYDIVLDGCDDTDTRYIVNAAAVKARIPLVSGALSQWEGQLTVFAPHEGSPCYRCVFPEPNAPGLAPSCAEGGVLGPLPGVVGAMMAVEAVKEIAGTGESLRGRMMIYDALYGETRTITLKRDPSCPVCGA